MLLLQAVASGDAIVYFLQIVPDVDTVLLLLELDCCCRLLQQVLARFEEEGGGHLLVATLCLLEVSQTGLLESELLKILADEDNIMPPTDTQEKGQWLKAIAVNQHK